MNKDTHKESKKRKTHISYFICLVFRLLFRQEFPFGIRNLASSKDTKQKDLKLCK